MGAGGTLAQGFVSRAGSGGGRADGGAAERLATGRKSGAEPFTANRPGHGGEDERCIPDMRVHLSHTH